MRLNEIHIEGFGRLVDRSFQFVPGLNLIFGPNETGKSTLQQAILALLYGFFSRGRIKASERKTATRFKPWERSASYGAWVIYTLDDGRAFRVSRTFAPSEVWLTTHPAGEDISSEFNGASQGRLAFADDQLGMSKEVFGNTCTIRQAELVALETSATAITDALMRLSASASPDTTTTDAMAALEKTVREEVGTDRAWTKPLPRARKCLSEWEEQRKKAVETRRELFSQIVELRQCQEQSGEREMECQRLRCLQTLADADEVRERLSAVTEATAEVDRLTEEAAKWERWAAFPMHLRDDVVRLSSEHDRLLATCNEAQEGAAAAREKLDPLRSQISDVEQRISALADAQDVPAQESPQVRELANEWKKANGEQQSAGKRWQKARSSAEQARNSIAQERAELGSVLQVGHAGLARLQQQLLNARERVSQTAEDLGQAQANWARVGMDEHRFHELERQAREIQSGLVPVPESRKGCRGCRWLSPRQPAAAANQPPKEVVVHSQIKPIRDNYLRCGAEADAAQKALDALEAEARSHLDGVIGNELEESAFAELGERVSCHQQAAAKLQQKEDVLAELQSELDSARDAYELAETALKTKLSHLGFRDTEVQTSLSDYIEQCQRKAQLVQEEAEIENLRLQARTLERDIQNWQEDRAALEETESGLCTLLKQASIECSPDAIETALNEFSEGISGHGRWAETDAALESAVRHQDALLSESGRSDLESSLAEVESRLSSMENEHPEWSDLEPDRSPRQYAAMIQQSDGALSAARERSNRLKDSIRLTASGLKHPAEIDEEIGVTRTGIRRLERFRDALKMAQRELEHATQEFQKQFAPKLEELVSEGLTRVTSGRYSDIHVDPDKLNVSLMAPELGQHVAVEQLSTGTRDMVYLMLRIGIARLVSGTKETLPLMLDDPLVQCDRDRQEQALGFLAQLAEGTQVLLFTKDEWTKAWFEKTLSDSPEHSVHELG